MRRIGFLLLLAGGAGGEDPEEKLAAEIQALLAELDAEVAAREEGGAGGEARALAAEVLALRRRAAERDGPGPSAAAETHIVFVGEASPAGGGSAAVRVTARDRPIVLVLGSQRGAVWNVEIAEGVDVRRILTVGNQDRLVLAVPHAPVEALPNGPAVGRGRLDPDLLAREVEEALGTVVWTVLPAERPDPARPFVVGPENAEWNVRHLRTEALLLRRRVTRAKRATQREALKAVRFGALYHWMEGRNLRSSFGAWTPLGPLLARQHRLPDILAAASAAVEDEDRHELYLLRMGVLVRLALPAGLPEVLRPPDTLPAVREPCAVAIDTRRKRLLLATKYDHGYLYALDLASREWSLVNDLADVDALGMAYDAQRDAILCVGYGKDGGLGVHRFSPEDGRQQRETPLAVAPLPEVRPLAAACVDGRLVIVYPPPSDLAHRTADEARAFVVEPHTGDVQFTTQVRPWEDFEPLDEALLDQLWEGLLGADAAGVGRAMRMLAGQGDAAVRFLARRFAPDPGIAGDLARWVDQLADDDPLLRELAQHRLVEAGRRAEDFLANLDTAALPVEARRRVAAILLTVVGPRRLQRGVRAVTVLEWVDSPAAESLLRDLAGRADGRRAAAAREALCRMGAAGR